MTTRRARLLAAAIAPLLLFSLPARAADPLLSTGLISVNSIHLTKPSLTSYPLDSPPINGYIPQVVFTLTDQQDKNDTSFSAHAYTLPASGAWTQPGSYIPSPGPKYFVATFDTGSQSHIVSYNDSLSLNLDAANRGGSYTQDVTGASGDETTDISDALGVYMTGFTNASSSGTSLSATPGSLKGQWNAAILTAESGSALPNIIGSPMAAQYQTVINNSNTRRLTVNNQTFRSPAVSFQPLNTSLPAGYSRLTLSVQSANGVSPQPTFFPSLDNFDNWADNPAAPTFWASLFATATASHTAGSSGAQDFLFDTGAEVSVLSEDTAASVGFYTGGPNPSTPDFTVEVSGVGGTTTEVPGFYLNSLSVTTNGGPITWSHVPVLVLDLPDPRDGVGFVPGILGTNLFTDRDLVINGGTTNPYVGISPIRTPRWNAPAPSSNWGNDDNWILGVPDAPDAPANFTSSTPGPHTITLDADYTAGSLSFNSPDSYTLAGTGRLTLQTSTSTHPSITVLQGSHKISAPLAFASPATLTLSPGATLDITTNTLLLDAGAPDAHPGLAQLRQYLHDSQLFSSTAQADPQHLLALGYLLDPSSDSITVKTTLLGDANLDGLLTPDDYALLDRAYARSTTDAHWTEGDFNYDGSITPADFLLIDTTLFHQSGSFTPAFLATRESEFGPQYVSALLASVPEPTSALSSILYLLSSLPLLRRRRRRTS